jgi:hypothetical protein
MKLLALWFGAGTLEHLYIVMNGASLLRYSRLMTHGIPVSGVGALLIHLLVLLVNVYAALGLWRGWKSARAVAVAACLCSLIFVASEMIAHRSLILETGVRVLLNGLILALLMKDTTPLRKPTPPTSGSAQDD